MKSFEELGRELERRGKTEDIKRIAESEDGQKLGRMVDAGDVERAAKAGDSAALQEMLRRVLSTDEGRRLAENVRRMMKD